MKVRIPAGVVALLVSGALVLGSARTASAGPSVFIEPRSTIVDPGEIFDVSVRIDDGVDTMSNFQILVEFDPAVIQFVEALEGTLYTETGNQTWFFFQEAVPGSLEVFDVIFPALSFILPPGELTRLRFEAAADGYSDIRFRGVTLKDILREDIPDVGTVDGYVCVGDAATGVEGADAAILSRRIDAPRPHPFRTSVRFGLRGAGAGSAVIGVFDARGRLVTEIRAEGSGFRSECFWNGCDSRGRPLPPGVFFLRWGGGDGAAVRRVVRVR